MQNAATSSGTSSAGRLTAATNCSRGSIPSDGSRGTATRATGPALRKTTRPTDDGRPSASRGSGRGARVPSSRRPVIVPPARRRAARALELVVVVGVGHRVVEAELLARRDGAHRHQQHRSDDPAVGIAGVVHVVGVVERRLAREEEVVVDLQRVDADRFVEAAELVHGRRRCRRTRRRSCRPGSPRPRTRPCPWCRRVGDRRAGESHDWRTGTSVWTRSTNGSERKGWQRTPKRRAGGGRDTRAVRRGSGKHRTRLDAPVRNGHNEGVSKRRERERLVRRRVASARRADDDRRPPVRAGRLSPRRAVPASIPRPPYAPDAPRARSRGAARRDPRAHARRRATPPARCCSSSEPRSRPASRPTSSTASATRRTSHAGGYPSTLDYKGYPKSLCTSVNEVICHGIPDDRALQDGDIVNCDVTIYLHGVHGDCSATFLVGDVDDAGRHLVQTTYESLVEGHRRGAARAVASTRSAARSRRTRRTNGFSVVRAFVGHGVGETFHTAPSVPHFFDPHADIDHRAGHDVHHRADDQRGRVGARPHLARRLDRADTRRLAFRPVRAQPARDADRQSRC